MTTLIGKKIQTEIRRILQENSGGIKLNALITGLSSALAPTHKSVFFEAIRDDGIIQILSDMDNVSIVRYDHDMSNGDGTGVLREKIFVCTRFEESR